MYDYDLFTIGGGSGGVRASRMAAQFGARVALAEERYLGGTCVNVGCIPKKLFVYASEFSEDFKDSAGFGWTVGERHFDWQTLHRQQEPRDRAAKRRLREGPGRRWRAHPARRGRRSSTRTRSWSAASA